LAHPVLTLFALATGEENSYTPEAPQGGFTVWFFEKIATGN
jgi:hypothetical protein